MRLQLTYRLFSLLLLFFAVHINGQNTISVKKTSPTIEAIFKSSNNSKTSQYYCFKKNGYVYYFNSNLKDEKVIKNCKTKQWLEMNSSHGKYFFNQDTITISPITYSMHGVETTNDFFYLAILDSTKLNVSVAGREDIKTFNLFFPSSLLNEK